MEEQRNHWNDKPAYVVFYWALLKCGLGYETEWHSHDWEDAACSYKFGISEEEKDWFPELQGADYISLWVTQGADENDATELEWHVHREKVAE